MHTLSITGKNVERNYTKLILFKNNNKYFFLY